MNEYKAEPETQPGNKVCASCGWARSKTSYVHFWGVVGGIVGSLIGYTFFDVMGALAGGFLGIVACELAARRALTPG